MQYTATVEASFDAGHLLPEHPQCGRLHGHHYRVLATAEGLMKRTGPPVDITELHTALTGVSGELDGRNLNEMLPGVVTTPHGIARYIMERLMGSWPSLQAITVWERPCCSATVTREVS